MSNNMLLMIVILFGNNTIEKFSFTFTADMDSIQIRYISGVVQIKVSGNRFCAGYNVKMLGNIETIVDYFVKDVLRAFDYFKKYPIKHIKEHGVIQKG